MDRHRFERALGEQRDRQDDPAIMMRRPYVAQGTGNAEAEHEPDRELPARQGAHAPLPMRPALRRRHRARRFGEGRSRPATREQQPDRHVPQRTAAEDQRHRAAMPGGAIDQADAEHEIDDEADRRDCQRPAVPADRSGRAGQRDHRGIAPRRAGDTRRNKHRERRGENRGGRRGRLVRHTRLRRPARQQHRAEADGEADLRPAERQSEQCRHRHAERRDRDGAPVERLGIALPAQGFGNMWVAQRTGEHRRPIPSVAGDRRPRDRPGCADRHA